MKPSLIFFCVLFAVNAIASGKHPRKDTLSPLEQYLHQYGSVATERVPAANGSLYSQDNGFAAMSTDYRAQRLNDLLIIRIVEQTVAQNSADVTAQRQVQATSAIPSIGGQSFDVLNPLLTLSSNHQLTGKGQADTQTKLQTSLAGRVVAVLPNGLMVVEAERRVHMNNETQTVVLRGMVRPGDVLADNSVFSTSLANLEIELKGKGVVSDATRPSNRLVRALLWLTGF
ncbi:MAG TPA: flagellar basal body L-ring protein FlgH [Terriglobales bacterium]|nr:flagellar basal body L-ring protein FlgH [Terriglobales bacterium]